MKSKACPTCGVATIDAADDPAWTAFLRAWLAAGGKESRASELIGLAERSGLPIAGETMGRRRTSLGMMLGRHEGHVIEVGGLRLRIRRGRLGSGYQFWKLENNH